MSARTTVLLVTVVLALAAGCATSSGPKPGADTVARFHLESPQGTPVALPRSQVGLMVNPKPVITEGDVVNVELVQVDLGRCLMFQLTPAAARDFYRLSGSNQGRRLVLFVNGTAVGARRIDGAITDGVVFVFVELPDEELPALVERLKRTAVVVQREIRRSGG